MSASPPLTIAHHAGNDLAKLAKAFAAGVSYVEADVWLYRGRLEVRHAKTAGPLPILWDRWSLKPGWTKRLLLSEILAVSGRGPLFLDLKGQAEGLAEAVATAVTRARIDDTVAFSTPVWSHLDRLSVLLPQVPRFYTIGTLAQLSERRPRLEQGEIQAVCINSRILTAEIASDLTTMGIQTIVTWGIKTEEEARRVLGWGVNGVTSSNLELLTAIRDGQLG